MGAVSMGGFRLLPKGYDGARLMYKRDLEENAAIEDFSQFYENVQIELSSSYKGFFMLPSIGSWNYNFMGHKYKNKVDCDITIGNPRTYYDDEHRPLHFLDFGTS